MVVPFGFSIGDFIAGINLTKDLVRTLKAEGGAVQQCQHLLEQLDRDCRTLRYFESLNLPQELASLETDIVQQADSLYHSSNHFLTAINQYQDQFNQVGSEKFYHGVRSKAKWFLSMEKKIEGYTKEVEVNRTNLNLLIGRLMIYGIDKDMKSRAAVLTRVDELEDHLRDRHQILVDQVNALQCSVATIQAINSGVMALRPSSISTSQFIHSAVGHVALPPPIPSTLQLSTCADTAVVPVAAMITGDVCSPVMELSSDFQSLSTSSPPDQEAGELVVFKDTMPISDAVGFVLPASEDYILALKRLTMVCGRLLEQCSNLHPQVMVLLYLFWTKLQPLPWSISSLLPDNLILVDFLGRTHSLQYCYFQHWSMVRHMLAQELKELPGANRIASEQFLLEVQTSRNTFRRLDSKHWAQLKPRSRIIMSATLARVETTSGTCPKFYKVAFLSNGSSWSCNKCLTSFRALKSGTDQSPGIETDQPEISLSQELDNQTQYKVRMELVNEMGKWNRRLSKALAKIELFKGSVRTANPSEFSLQLGGIDSVDERTQADTNAQESKNHYQSLNAGSDHAEDEPVPPTQWSTRESECNDIRAFKHVSLRIIGQVYEAARKGNAVLTKSLMEAGYDPVLDEGPLGHPIDVAVLSGSIETFRILLNFGADPLTKTGPFRTPIETAARKGYLEILWMLLDPNWRRSNRRSKERRSCKLEFRREMDSALLFATWGNRLDVVQVLLYYGANPSGWRLKWRPCAIEITNRFGSKGLLELFVANAFARRGGYTCSSDHDLFAALDGPYRTSGIPEKLLKEQEEYSLFFCRICDPGETGSCNFNWKDHFERHLKRVRLWDELSTRRYSRSADESAPGASQLFREDQSEHWTSVYRAFTTRRDPGIGFQSTAATAATAAIAATTATAATESSAA